MHAMNSNDPLHIMMLQIQFNTNKSIDYDAPKSLAVELVCKSTNANDGCDLNADERASCSLGGQAWPPKPAAKQAEDAVTIQQNRIGTKAQSNTMNNNNGDSNKDAKVPTRKPAEDVGLKETSASGGVPASGHMRRIGLFDGARFFCGANF